MTTTNDAPAPAPSGSGARVKPLEWHEGRTQPPEYHASAFSIVGGYAAISFETIGSKPRVIHLWTNPDGKDTRVGSFDEAKAAAQADYEARILSALASDASQEPCDYCGEGKRTGLPYPEFSK